MLLYYNPVSKIKSWSKHNRVLLIVRKRRYFLLSRNVSHATVGHMWLIKTKLTTFKKHDDLWVPVDAPCAIARCYPTPHTHFLSSFCLPLQSTHPTNDTSADNPINFTPLFISPCPKGRYICPPKSMPSKALSSSCNVTRSFSNLQQSALFPGNCPDIRYIQFSLINQDGAIQ